MESNNNFNAKNMESTSQNSKNSNIDCHDFATQSPSMTNNKDSKKLPNSITFTPQKYRNFILIILLFPLPFFAIIATLLYLYDPMQVWHKPFWREPTFFSAANNRAQAKGIIDYYDFDSLMLGSSFLFKSSEALADSLLGGKWLNISTGGLGLPEKSTILDYALRKKGLKATLISIEWFYVALGSSEKIAYLYDESAANNIKLYLNPRFVWCAITWSKSSDCIGDSKTHLNRQYARSPEPKIDALQGAKEWLKRNKNDRIMPKLLDYEKYPFVLKKREFDAAKIKRHNDYLEKYIFCLARAYPATRFYLVLPPHTRLTYRLMDEVEDFYEWGEVLKMLVLKASKLENMKVYGFDDMDFPDNLGNYHDLTHFNSWMNDYEIESIANNLHILTPQNIDKYIEITESKIRNYDMETLRKLYSETQKER
ncbi:hypothetical protein DCO58_07950 [Helicobacter saguini]|uniref:Uncharacterized protein n=1 Tax=Helicobacter saguini TaxID=1548018 RepID=A0A347VNJ8_9HELI|nr:hypothetical protein [Helicobacter saguini]MWV61740.1 hypothetical protein [Helicobacter saguini]MWV67587.1 hypothetical protein [Helicobacter saguini]MWV69938.1 hypothetical protein [Helicobacter saguini]MWV72847.1 hypothetical protein [Helicobacter saguini]TLD92386.1 hypothetical protein LS64_010365 [Helicobacter saguini]